MQAGSSSTLQRRQQWLWFPGLRLDSAVALPDLRGTTADL